MKSLVWIFRLAVGLLFIFSGLVKLNDPIGFAYKLDEYFVVFNVRYLSHFSTFLSIAICSFEVVAGAALLIGYRTKMTVSVLLLLILFFSSLTFYSAYFHKVNECGCFGDAIKLTPWQSFEKNMGLLSMILVLTFTTQHIKPLLKHSGAFVVVAALAAVGFGLFTYNYLPVIDFLPYKKGNNLPRLMAIPKGAKTDVYRIMYTLKNKKTGLLKRVDDHTYVKSGIYNDPDWEYLAASDPILISAGYQAPLRDLQITDAQGDDLTHEIVEDPNYSLWVVEYKLSGQNYKIQQQLNLLASKVVDYNVRMIGLTAVSAQEADDFCKRVNPMYEMFYCDEIPLKEMIRSDPGLMLLKDGTVLGKWPYHDLPDYNRLKKEFFEKQ